MKKLFDALFHPMPYLVAVLIRLSPLWDFLGFHITRKHFYSPIPDTASLTDDIWQHDSQLVGIEMRDSSQLELLSGFSQRFKEEYGRFPRKQQTPHQYYLGNLPFGPLDGIILYCMIRHFRPSRVVEIGSGFSTFLSAQAILKNEEETGKLAELIAIDPYPNQVLRKGFPGLSRLVPRKVQNVNLSEFTSLAENDILFIDSSHVLRIGNDVQYEYLEILPRLNRGVVVHVHDIFFPKEYPRHWVLKWRNFFTEQYLLQAFLAFNSAFEVLWAGNYMVLRHPESLQAALASCDVAVTGAGSLWMRKTT